MASPSSTSGLPGSSRLSEMINRSPMKGFSSAPSCRVMTPHRSIQRWCSSVWLRISSQPQPAPAQASPSARWPESQPGPAAIWSLQFRPSITDREWRYKRRYIQGRPSSQAFLQQSIQSTAYGHPLRLSPEFWLSWHVQGKPCREGAAQDLSQRRGGVKDSCSGPASITSSWRRARAPLPLGRASQVLPVPGGPLHEPKAHKPRPPPQIHESPDMTRKDRYSIHLVGSGDL
jgi:hypothetical protein